MLYLVIPLSSTEHGKEKSTSVINPYSVVAGRVRQKARSTGGADVVHGLHGHRVRCSALETCRRSCRSGGIRRSQDYQDETRYRGEWLMLGL